MRSLYFTAAESGMTRAQLRHGEAVGRHRRILRGTYRFGPEPATALDECIALVIATDGAASGSVAGVLYGLDSVHLARPEVSLPPGSTNRHRRVHNRVQH